MCGIDDFQQEAFDSFAHGSSAARRQHREPEAAPRHRARPSAAGLQPWGTPYKDHLRRWQSVIAIRIQPDALPYTTDFVDLDPLLAGHQRPRPARHARHLRDCAPTRTGWSAGCRRKAAELLRLMGATSTWPTARFKGVLSSHDLGGARMGEDPATSVVDPDLQVHDTPGCTCSAARCSRRRTASTRT